MIAVIGVVFILNKKNQNSSEITEYIICNNENGIFDGTVGPDVRRSYALPFWSPSESFDEEVIEAIDSIEGIDIYPCYNLNVFGVEYINEQEFPLNEIIQYHQINNSGSFTIPFKQESTEDTCRVSNLLIKPYVTSSSFFEAIEKCNDGNGEVIIKEFNSQSGIFISDKLYNEMNIDESEDRLFLKLPVSARVFKNPNLNEYAINEYRIVLITLEVQGVISKTGNRFCFCEDNDIVVPYQLSKDIYEMINWNEIKETEERKYWVPNSYIIQCKNGETIKEAGEKVQTVTHDFILEEYNYISQAPNKMLFK